MSRPLSLILPLLLALLPASAQMDMNEAPTPGGKEMAVLAFPNADVKAVLREYESLTGKIVILDNNVSGTVNITVDEPISRAERIKIIETNLLMNGISLIPAGGRTVKAVGGTTNPTTEGVPILNDPEEIPTTDRIISFYHRLQYAGAEAVRDQVTAYITFSPDNPSAQSLVAFADAQAVMITGSSTVVRRALTLINAIDQAPAKVVSVFIPLQRANALKVLEQLTEIFEEDAQTQQRTAARNAARTAAQQRNTAPGQPNQPAAPVVQSAAGSLTVSEDSFVQGKLKIVADERTNRIQLITREVNLPFLRDLISQLDAEATFGTPKRFPLYFVRAGEVLPVIVEALTEPGTEAGEVVTADSDSASSGTGSGSGGNASSGSGGSTGGGINVNEMLNTEPVDVTPQAVTVGNTRLIADRESNAIVVMGNTQAKETVAKVVAQLDVRAPQVMFNVVIGELDLEKNEAWGIDLLVRLFNGGFVGANKTTSATFDPGLAAATQSSDSTSVFPITNASPSFAPIVQGVGAATGMTAFFAFGDTLAGFIRALESTTRFRVISRPTIFTKNNKKAVIVSGEEVAVPVATTSSFTGDSTPVTTSNIEYKKIALQLEVVPLINDQGEISLDVLQQIDNQIGTTTIDNNDIPRISTRYIRTHVDVPDGATVFLGGLIIDNKNKTSNGLPGLSRIPVLGFLFGGFEKDQRRTELIIMITPTVVDKPQGLDVARDMIGRDYILPTDVEMELVPAKKYTESSALIPLDNPYPKPALEAIQDGEATPEQFGWRWASPPVAPPAETTAGATDTAPSLNETAGTKTRGPARKLQPRPLAPAEGPILEPSRKVSANPTPAEGGSRTDDDPTLIAPRRTVEEQAPLQLKVVPDATTPGEVQPLFVPPDTTVTP